MSSLSLIPLTLDEANRFVDEHHRHNDPVVGHMWSTGAELDGRLVGVSIVGRPVARHLDNGLTVEVLRVATDGTRNAVSFLNGAACRAAFARGFRKVVTYTLKSESGSSLRAAGYRVLGEVKGRHWNTPSRPREEGPLFDKLRWEITA